MNSHALKITLFIIFLGFPAAAQSGGTFTIEKSVVSSGGGTSSGGTITVVQVTGQPVAETIQNGALSISGGFLTPNLAPTAASVVVAGRVNTAGGQGISNAVVTLTDISGNARYTVTGHFGMFEFSGVVAGQSYIVSVSSNRFSFEEPSRLVVVVDSVFNINFIANAL